MTSTEQQVLDGLILSDAHLRVCGKNASLCMRVKFRSFLEKVVYLLPSFNWAPIKEQNRFDKRTNKTYYGYEARTRVDTRLTKCHELWYKKKKKVVPADFTLNENTLLWWYIGDGCLCRKKSRPNYRRIAFATDSFTNKERSFLILQLKQFLRSKNVYSENRKIYISRDAVVAFAQIFRGKCPVKDYEYKFDFGQYCDVGYLARSYRARPLQLIINTEKFIRLENWIFRM